MEFSSLDWGMDVTERARLLATLRSTARELPRLVETFPEGLVRWRPAPGKWSALEVLCHMRDMEREAYLVRYRRILAEKKPLLPDIDGDITSVENDYLGVDPAAVVSDWSRLRAEVLALLLPLDADSWWRDGVHPARRPPPMGDLLRPQGGRYRGAPLAHR